MKFITKNKFHIFSRKKDSRKGDNGIVLAIGGSENYPGAIALAGLAALRSGCDLVRVIAPEKAAWAINCYSPDLITVKAKGRALGINHLDMIKKYSEKSDVILLGNGMGLEKGTQELCKKAAGIKVPKVIDADAIKSISMKNVENSIITPHSKELEIFLKNSNIRDSTVQKITNEKSIEKKSKAIQKACSSFLKHGNIILLKGPVDAVISAGKIKFVKGGNPGMTKGGTGDVLAGLSAGFLAQSKDLLQSAVNASYFNKRVGDILLRKKKGFAFLASDMVKEIKRIQSWT